MIYNLQNSDIDASDIRKHLAQQPKFVLLEAAEPLSFRHLAEEIEQTLSEVIACGSCPNSPVNRHQVLDLRPGVSRLSPTYIGLLGWQNS
jgi:hypothetical protein